MKTFIPLMLTILLSVSSEAKEQTLLPAGGDWERQFGCQFNSMELSGNRSVLFGIDGGWIYNRTLFMGGNIEFSLLSLQPNYSSIEAKRHFYQFTLGLKMEYESNHNNLIHHSYALMMGIGGATYTDSIIEPNRSSSSSFFVSNMTINVLLNLVDKFKIGVGGGYRFTYGLDLFQVSDKDLSGVTIKFIVKYLPGK